MPEPGEGRVLIDNPMTVRLYDDDLPACERRMLPHLQVGSPGSAALAHSAADPQAGNPDERRKPRSPFRHE